MAPYASYADAVALMGEDAIKSALPRDASDPEAAFETFLSSASSDVDAVLQRAGYVAPVDFTASPLSEALTRLQTKLKTMTAALALFDAYSLVGAEIPQGLAKKLEADTDWMVALREGRISMPAPRERTSMGMADDASTTTPDIAPSTFDTFRTYAGCR